MNCVRLDYVWFGYVRLDSVMLCCVRLDYATLGYIKLDRVKLP